MIGKFSDETIGSRLDRFDGVGPGFDLTRLALATLVIFIHASLSGGVSEADPAFPGAPFGRWAISIAAVPMFFALSGFLIAASAERLSVRAFLANRLLRIAPALAVAAALAALALGPLLTRLPLHDYFADMRLWSYALNVVGLPRYALPGLFETNPEPGVVNGSLWTVPHEISCYVGVALLMAFGLHRRRRLLLLATVGLFAISVIAFALALLPTRLPGQDALTYAFVTRGAARLPPVFLLGMLFYHYRHAIPYRRDFAFGALGLYFAIAAFGSPDWAQNPIFNLVAAPLYAYVVIAAGLSPTLRVDALKGNDFSYGIYLYGFPVQQALVASMPWLKSAPLFFVVSFAAVAPIAMLSWRYVEKPALKLRRGAMAFASTRNAARQAQAQLGAAVGRRDRAAAV